MHRVFLLVALIWGSGVAAQPFADCTKAENRAIAEAISAAKAISLVAAARVADTPEFTRWFGKYTPQSEEIVRRNLKSTVSALRTGRVDAICENTSFSGCGQGYYAYVYSNEPFMLHVCPAFFDMPTIASLAPGTSASDNGTREGTIIHELTHFDRVAGTEDHCYSRLDCQEMAVNAPDRAINNADSYQYYAEDMVHFAQDLGLLETQIYNGERPE